MAVFKCKMCGGDLEIVNGESVCECEYCGTKQTIPTTDSEKLTNLYNRANRLRFNNEFDKAAGIFENITAEYPEEAEAYWGLCLCKYGIEYVDDPATAKKIPTCHRTSLESIFDDSNFELAQEYADSVAQRLYREEAKEIDRLQKAILDIAKNEKPYDIFICYKETAPDGQRTKDSVMAQDIYDALIAKGYKVFFARITLEDKLGQEYEPYIFAALSSAKIMLSVGTSYENFNAVWVKNEWSRYLSLMKTDKSKVLIPCYCDCDAYDMPQEFKNLQGQDMGKVGFIQDLVRGVGKIVPAPNDVAQNTVQQTVVQQVVSSNAENLLKRGFMSLEASEWDEADRFFERVLDENAECSEAYLGKLLAELKAHDKEELASYSSVFDGKPSYSKVMHFCSDEVKEYVVKCNKNIQQRLADEKLRKQEESREQLLAYRNKTMKYNALQKLICASAYHSVGLLSDGTVVAIGDSSMHQCDVESWYDIIQISSNGFTTIGLKENGTVVSTPCKENHGQCLVDKWVDIIEVSSNTSHTVGLRSDGTVVSTPPPPKGAGEYDKGQCNVDGWHDIVAISAGFSHTVGLKSDGTVVATKFRFSGENNEYHGQCNVDGWHDIVAISAGFSHTVGLKSDGTVVATKYSGDPKYYCGQCDVDDWKDIVAISAGNHHTVGLHSDGTVVVTKNKDNIFGNPNEAESWSGIVAISAGQDYIIGLKQDGTVLSTKCNGVIYYGQDLVSRWKLFSDFRNLEKERIEMRAQRIQKNKAEIAELERLNEQLLRELSEVKGLFSGTKKKKLEAQIDEINAQINSLKLQITKE